MTASDPPAVAAPARLGRALQRSVRALARVLLWLWIVLAGLLVLVRYLLFPLAGDFHGDIAAAASRALGLPVSIVAMDTDWVGWRPRLHLSGVSVADAAGRPALQLSRVDATLSWTSLLRGAPNFRRLEIFSPELALRREADGSIYVAGLPVGAGGDDSGGLQWLLDQGQVLIHDARVSWVDQLRQAPELKLQQVEFRLDRGLGQHRFALRAQPPADLASTLDLRGELWHFDAAAPAASSGRLYVALERADLGGWEHWVDYPLPLEGTGAVHAWLASGSKRRLGRSTADSELRWSLDADVALNAVRTRLAADLPELALAHLQGQLGVARERGELRVHGTQLSLSAGDALALPAADFELRLRDAGHAEGEGGALSASRLDFRVLAALAAHLPFDDGARAQLAAFAPEGEATALRSAWTGAAGAPQSWSLAAQFNGIGLAARDGLPGLGGLSGAIDGSDSGGRFRLAAQGAHIDLPEVFENGRLDFDRLRAEGGWQRRDGAQEITLDVAEFENADAAGNAAGVYRPQADGAGHIDLQAKLTRAEGTAVWRYLPRVVNRDTHEWVRNAIRRAVVPEASLRLRGALDEFPFADGNGEFLVVVRVADALLEYAPHWPPIEGIFGEVRFQGPGMRILADQGSIFGVKLSKVVADVPDLDAPQGEVMSITGQAAGPTTEFLRFVSASPVSARIGGFTEDMRAEGSGTLDLKLVMPLRHVVDTAVDGAFRFSANRLWLGTVLPVLEQAGGTVRFSAEDLSIPQAQARFLGEPLRLSAQTGKDGAVRFDASGGVSAAALRALAEGAALDHLSGRADWRAQIRLGRDDVEVEVDSALVGFASSLPAPLNKGAEESWPVHARLSHASAAPWRLSVKSPDRLAAQLVRRAEDWGGTITLGAQAAAPEADSAGLALGGVFEVLDVDAWRRVLDEEPTAGEDAQPAAAAFPALARVDVRATEAHAFGQVLKAVELQARNRGGNWTARLKSDVADGEFEWHADGDGTLVGRFRHLQLGRADGERTVAEEEQGAQDRTPPRRLPALDITVERFALRGLDLGRLEVFARNRDGSWQLDRLALHNADGEFSGSGFWRARGAQRTQLDFSLHTPDVGRFSARLGYPDVVRGGQATLSGKLEWADAPTRIDYRSLAGQMQLDAGAGQFRKLEPGVGRLLGILSLQALPRRITLDFRDVFSEGFAFDRISGSIAVARGVMRTEDLEIRGPAARVRMTGSADVEAETQDLRVAVQPTLSESVAIGAAAGLLNPVAGVVTYLAQKALSDPIEKLFAYQYAITGSWADPRVERVASPPRAD